MGTALQNYYNLISQKSSKNPRWEELLHRHSKLGFSYDPFALGESQNLHIDHIHRCLNHITLLGVYKLYLTEESKQNYTIGIYEDKNGKLNHTYLRNLYKNQDCGLKSFTNLFYLDTIDVGERLKEVYLNPLEWGNVGNLSWIGDFSKIRWVNNEEVLVPIKNKPYLIKISLEELINNRKYNDDPLKGYVDLPPNDVLRDFSYKKRIVVLKNDGVNCYLYHKASTRVTVYDESVNLSHKISLAQYVKDGHLHPLSRNGFSQYEELFYRSLLATNDEFVKEWVVKSGGRLFRFDFFIPQKKLIIEIDGIQHFTTNTLISYRIQQEIDKMKEELIKTNLFYSDFSIKRVCVPHLKALLKYSNYERTKLDIINLFSQYLTELPSININDYIVTNLEPLFPSLKDWMDKNDWYHPLY